MRETWFTYSDFDCDFDGRYSISNTGYVRDDYMHRDAFEKATPAGVRWAQLTDKLGVRHWRRVSSMVFETICGRIRPGYVLEYGDENRKNCHIDNLYLSRGNHSPVKLPTRVACVKYGHPLTSWNADAGGRCKACKAAHGSTSTPDEEFARLYEKHYGVPYVDDRAEYFDRSGIGVWDIYSGL